MKNFAKRVESLENRVGIRGKPVPILIIRKYNGEGYDFEREDIETWITYQKQRAAYKNPCLPMIFVADPELEAQARRERQ